ncbi:MAG: DNA/RNA non-specific endonuclease [Verrucomicrobia bacterium]|nr:DNA/RNA non-specific endonuclease [Verrucomicrobiota bacterium]
MKRIFRTLSIAAAALSIGLLSGYNCAIRQKKPLPISEIKVERRAYELAYDGQHKQARWVYERLTADSVKGASDRSDFDFQEDPFIPAVLRSTKADYAKSGFDRGHLCPAADARFSDEAMKETFYLSNISPQCPQLNRGYWLKLEKHVRDLTNRYEVIHVFTGGLYLPKQEADGKWYVRYQVIGKNDVAVPTHFFKVVLDDRGKSIEAFILPNEPITTNTPLESFMSTTEKVEKAAGIYFQCL